LARQAAHDASRSIGYCQAATRTGAVMRAP
jgi:hypothetical protein